MNDNSTLKLIIALIELAAVMGYIYYLSRVIDVTKNAREKLYIFGSSIGFLLLIVMLVPFAYAFISGTYDPKGQMPAWTLPFLACLPLSLIIIGLTQILFANEAVVLYARRRRSKGAVNKLLVSELPKRESFITRGIMGVATGSVVLIVFIVMFLRG